MAKVDSKKSWGEWILVRGRLVGFRRQKDLADAIGCTQGQLSRWVQMTSPPAMRKGFDQKLANSLLTTTDILFNQWQQIPPELVEKRAPKPNLTRVLYGDLMSEVARRWVAEQDQIIDTIEAAEKLNWEKQYSKIQQEIQQLEAAGYNGKMLAASLDDAMTIVASLEEFINHGNRYEPRNFAAGNKDLTAAARHKVRSIVDQTLFERAKAVATKPAYQSVKSLVGQFTKAISDRLVPSETGDKLHAIFSMLTKNTPD